MTRIEFADGGVSIDAEFLAQAFALDQAQLRRQMHEGAITSRFETGEGEDAGRVRLTFFSADRRVRVTADRDGRILSHSTADMRRRDGETDRSVTP